MSEDRLGKPPHIIEGRGFAPVNQGDGARGKGKRCSVFPFQLQSGESE